jgi:hypothetical protein
MAVGFQQRRTDGVRPAHPVIVENGESAHERNSVAHVWSLAAAWNLAGYFQFSALDKQVKLTPPSQLP